MGALVVTVNECLRRLQQSCQAGKELTMGHFAAALPPQPLNGVEPRAVGRQRQQDQPPGRGTDDRFALIISRGIRLIPGHIDGARGMLVDQGLHQFGDLPAPFAAAEEHDGVAGVVVDGAQALPLVWLPWGGDHAWLAPRAPQGTQGGQPADVDFVGIVEHLASVQLIAGVFKRLFFSAYAGSGRLI
jgi:hypothetical protein